MSYMITHFYEGGTDAQYRATRDAVHPPGGLPEGQTHHFAGPTDGGYLVVAIWDSKESNDRFINEVLTPALPTIEGGLVGPPQERTAEVAAHEVGV
jgi:hypothetical protein